MIEFKLLHPGMTLASLGYIPLFLDERDPRPAHQQIGLNYIHGGGWRPYKGFQKDPLTHRLKHPGDPPMYPVASANLRNELILVYPSDWVCIVQPNGSWEIARID